MFLGEHLGFFISSCFRFFMFWFLMSLLLIAFVCFTVSLLFVRYFIFVLLLRVLQIREIVFYSQTFFTLDSFLLLSSFPCGQLFCLEGCRASHWGSKHRPGPFVCLNHTVFSNYMISRELYLNCHNMLISYLWRRVW